jgi:hypothetical protein
MPFHSCSYPHNNVLIRLFPEGYSTNGYLQDNTIHILRKEYIATATHHQKIRITILERFEVRVGEQVLQRLLVLYRKEMLTLNVNTESIVLFE